MWKKKKKKKVLVIDDEVDFTKLLKLNLEATGRYKVETENEGSFAIDIVKKFKPDLIFLDIVMPDMEGGQVASQLKTYEDTKNIPIVFLTALVRGEEVNRLGDARGVIGGYPFIAKPVSVEKLIDVIEKNIS